MPRRQPERLPYSSEDAMSNSNKSRAICYALSVQRESRQNFASSGIHVSKQLLVALIIARN
jgi:hypothetical protein